MARSILEIIIQTLRRGTGFEDTQKSLKGLDSAAQSISRTLGVFGVAVGAKEMVDFANASREAARSATDAQNALTGLVGSTGAYHQAVQQVQETTRDTVSEIDAARIAFSLMDNGIAKSADEAAKFAMAGKAYNSALGETASFEKFLMLLDEGSDMLLNNFNITGSAVEARQRLIEANGNLSGSEAKLQAVRELALEKGLALADTISKETIAYQQAAAAQQNFIASFGALINTLDQSAGASNFVTAALNELTEGAKAWQTVINEQIPAIQQHEAALAADAAQTILTAQGYDELEAATDAAAKNSEAFREALLRNVDTHAEYQAAVDKVAESNIFLAGELDTTAEEFTNLKAAMSDAVVTSGAWASSLNAMNIVAAQTVQKTVELTQAQQDLANQAKTSAFIPQTNRELDAYRQMAEARGQSVEIQAEFEKKQTQETEADKRRQFEQTEKQYQKHTQAIAKAFDEVGSQISSAVSGAIGDLTEVWNPGGETDAANGAAQWARRMAAIAAGGLQDEWANPERWANFGGDKSVLQPLFNAISSGDDTQVKAQAQALLANKTADLFDANMIAAQVEQKLRAQQIQQVLNDRVNALLGERGLQAVTNVTQQIAGVATDTQTATTAVGESVTGLGTSAETSAAKISESFTGAIAPIDTLNARLKLMAGLIERVNTLAGQAAGNIAGMNPPAAPGADAQNKMGGNAPL